MNKSRRDWLRTIAAASMSLYSRFAIAKEIQPKPRDLSWKFPPENPFGAEFPELDSLTTGSW